MKVDTRYSLLDYVKIKELQVSGRIIGIFIGIGGVEYKVRYNAPNEYKEIYFFEDEIVSRTDE